MPVMAIISLVALACLRLAALGTAFTLFADRFWLGELAISFTRQYLVAGLVCVPFVALAFNDSKTFYPHLSLLLCVMGINFYHLNNAAAYGAQKTSAPRSALQVFHLNALRTNVKFAKTARVLAADIQQADIFNIQEFTAAMAPALGEATKKMAFTYATPQEDGMGAAFFSRQKPDNFQVHGLHNGTTFIYHASYKGALVDASGTPQDLDIFTLHTFAPVTPRALRFRNEQLQKLAGLVSESRAPYKIVVGDLNITPFSPAFLGFLKTAKLKHTALPWSSAGTWPFKSTLSVFGLPIDHVLISENLGYSDKKILAAPGSDHLAVRIKIAPLP